MDNNPYERPFKLIDAAPSPFLGIGFKVVAGAVWLFDVLDAATGNREFHRLKDSNV